jgi:hypothetical protein
MTAIQHACTLEKAKEPVARQDTDIHEIIAMHTYILHFKT